MLAGVGATAAWLRGRHGGGAGPVRCLAARSAGDAARKPGRSLAVAGLLAAGVFMISAMAAFQLDARGAAHDRRSGTGGFAFVGESTLPVYDDLNQPAGRAAVGLEEEEGRAACRLCRPGCGTATRRVVSTSETAQQNPRVLGVSAAALQQRGAFAFLARGSQDWSVIEASDGTGPVPAVMDANYVRYTIKAKRGDVLSVRDDRGGLASLRIAALLEPSVLQGSAVISETAFEKLFPRIRGLPLFPHRRARPRNRGDHRKASHPIAGEPRSRPDPVRGAPE